MDQGAGPGGALPAKARINRLEFAPNASGSASASHLSRVRPRICRTFLGVTGKGLWPETSCSRAESAIRAPGSVDHYLGLLAAIEGRFDQAGRHFEAAHATHEALAAPAWLARTRLEWARMLLTRGRSVDAGPARDLLQQALDIARNLGLGSVERQALGLLQKYH
jgi:hypothetical protein